MLNEKLYQAYVNAYKNILNNQELLKDMIDFTEIIDGIIPEPTEEEYREYLYKKYNDSMVQRVISAYVIEHKDARVSSFIKYINYLFITPGAETQVLNAYYTRLKKQLEEIKEETF